MSVAISPIHTTKTFTYPLTLDQKIEVFVARVEGWQIRPALDMRSSNIPNRGYAQLAIVTSYFEMIAKYIDGYLGDRASSKYFKQGLLYTFPHLCENEKEILEAFYFRIRNGLYHVGVTRPNVFLYDGINQSFFYDFNNTLLVISPDKFVEELEKQFEIFTNELRNPRNIDLRRNFESRFDYDNREIENISKDKSDE